MILARSLHTPANSSNDTASTRVLGEGAACKDSEPLVRSLTACHLPADTHSNDHAQTLLDEVCECCFSAYCSRTNKTTRRLFSRDAAYRKPIRRMHHDCYSFSDERHEMKRSDPPLTQTPLSGVLDVVLPRSYQPHLWGSAYEQVPLSPARTSLIKLLNTTADKRPPH